MSLRAVREQALDTHAHPTSSQLPIWMTRRIILSILSLSLSLGLSVFTNAWSCGVNAHLWITDSAICQLPETSRLRALYEQQRHVDLTRLGSAFPDSGYAINHDYGEIAHWPPFIQSYIVDFQMRFGVDETLWSEDAWDEVAFILGVAAHGFEDELFDSQFLRWVEQEDGADQDVLDPALDFLLIYEGHSELYPPDSFPSVGVTSALRSVGVNVSADEVELGVTRVRQIALQLTQNPPGLQAIVEHNAPLIPWASRHYQSREIRGSLGHEPRVVAALLEATYLRIRGESVESLALSWVDPSEPDVLDRAGVETLDESRWVSLYFAVAARTDDIITALTLKNEEGLPIEYEWRGTRWGGGAGFTHLFEVAPRVLTPHQQHLTLELSGGIELINGEITREASTHQIDLCVAERCSPPELPEILWGGRQRGCWVESSHDGADENAEVISHDAAIHDQGTNDQAARDNGQATLMERLSRDQGETPSRMTLDESLSNDQIDAPPSEIDRSRQAAGCQSAQVNTTPLTLFMTLMIGLCVRRITKTSCDT